MKNDNDKQIVPIKNNVLQLKDSLPVEPGIQELTEYAIALYNLPHKKKAYTGK